MKKPLGKLAMSIAATAVLVGCAQVSGAVGDLRIRQYQEMVGDKQGWVVADEEARRVAEFPDGVRAAIYVFPLLEVALVVTCNFELPEAVGLAFTSPRIAASAPFVEELELSVNGVTGTAKRLEPATFVVETQSTEGLLRAFSTSPVGKLSVEGQYLTTMHRNNGAIDTVVDECRNAWASS